MNTFNSRLSDDPHGLLVEFANEERWQAMMTYAERHRGDVGQEGARAEGAQASFAGFAPDFDVLRQAVEHAALEHERAKMEWFEGLEKGL